jgi:hypothetical protein
MSVSGEFQRALRACVAALPPSARLARALEEAARLGREDLSKAARRVLELLDGPQLSARAPERGHEELEAAAAHLRAICRVILGHPPAPRG